METIKLDLIPGKKMPSLHASQFDDGRTHGIDLFENGVVYKLDGTETLTINERKGDDCICSLDIENTFTGSNHIVFASTEQMCAVWGNNICELVITKGEKTIGTLNFILEIEPSPTENGIESESEISNLERQIEEITEQVIGDNYYTAEETDDAIATATEGKADKTYVDTELAKKADKSDTYTKAQVDSALSGKANVGASYTKSEEDALLANKAGIADVYNKQTVDNKLAEKANTSDVNTALATKADVTTVSALSGNIAFLNHSKADKETTYTKAQVDSALSGKANVGVSYTKSEEDNLLSGKADKADTYTKSEVDNVLGNKADKSTTYTKQETDTLLSNKADMSDTYTKEQVDDIVYNILPDDTASGSVANFNTSLEMPIKSLEIDVNAVQASGTPTPTTPLPISGRSAIKLINCGRNMVDIRPFNEWTAVRTSYYVLRSCLPNTIINASLIDKDTSVDLSGISFGFVDSAWDGTEQLTTKEYRWIIQNGIVQSGKRNISAGDASKILTGLIFYPQTEETYNKVMARYNIEVEFETVSTYEPYNGTTEVINLGGTYYGGHFTQDKAGHRQLVIDMAKDKMTSSYLSRLSSSYIGYDASVPAMNNHPCVWVRNWEYPPNAKGRVDGGIKSLCNAFKITMNNSNIISTQYRIYFDVDGLNITDEAGFISAVETMEQNGYDLEIAYELETSIVIDLPDGEPIITLIGTNNIFADTGDTEVMFKCSVNDYVSAHSGGNLLGMGGVYLGGAKSGGGEEEPDEGEDTEKTKEIDELKEEIKTIGDDANIKKIGGE